MHTPAPPKIMQQKTTTYKDVVEDIKNFLRKNSDKLIKLKFHKIKYGLIQELDLGKI